MMTAFVDRETLDAYTMRDPVLQKELFEIYFKQADFYVDQLREAVEKASQQPWEDAAHGLIGAARALGMIQAAEIIHEFEKCVPSHVMLAQIIEVLDKTHDAVMKLE